jgi:hypothetical protein
MIHELSSLLEKKEFVPLGRIPDLLSRKDLADKIDRIGLIRGQGIFSDYEVKVYKSREDLKKACDRVQKDLDKYPDVVALVNDQRIKGQQSILNGRYQEFSKTST